MAYTNCDQELIENYGNQFPEEYHRSRNELVKSRSQYGARPAFTMLELGKPRAQTPRGSSGDLPARNSATMIVLDKPSGTVVNVAPKFADIKGLEVKPFTTPAELVFFSLPLATWS